MFDWHWAHFKSWLNSLKENTLPRHQATATTLEEPSNPALRLWSKSRLLLQNSASLFLVWLPSYILASKQCLSLKSSHGCFQFSTLASVNMSSPVQKVASVCHQNPVIFSVSWIYLLHLVWIYILLQQIIFGWWNIYEQYKGHIKGHRDHQLDN